jgi:hypothetical protein
MILYAVRQDGALLWYEHFRTTDHKSIWLGPQQVNKGWQKYRWAFSGENGTIYAVQPGGRLLWFDHLEQASGGDSWNGPKQVDTGWRKFANAFPGDGGVIYALQKDGVLLWHKHLGDRDGTPTWAGPKQVGTGFQAYQSVFAGSGGALYAIQNDGTLLWFKHLGIQDGSFSWDGPMHVGSGWQDFQQVFTGGDGVIYAVQNDGTLVWYQHRGFHDGSALWDGPEQVGSGWQFLHVFTAESLLEGYCFPLSVFPGENITFMVSSPSAYQITFVRFKRHDAQHDAIPVAAPVPRPGGVQPVQPDAWANGCGWTASFNFQVPVDWASGIYAAECSRGDAHTFRIAFVVKPRPENRGDFAVLANTNTWNAYNDWGGRSKYTDPPATSLSFLRPNPAAAPIDAGGYNHLTRAELWVLDWLASAGYRVDMYADFDLHQGIDGLAQYKGLILDTHPEYWSRQMLDHLEAYLAGGGSVVYLAGNGVFEEVVFSANGDRLTMFPDGPDRPQSFLRNLQPPRPERNVLGVAFRFDNWMTFAPFQVLKADHPLFAGTNVADGDSIGATGINGDGASGWEMDTSIPGLAPAGTIVSATGADDRGSPPANLEVLARGTNPGYGADITYYETGAGGFVFSAGSLSFGGCLVVDPVLQRIVGNVLNKCLS